MQFMVAGPIGASGQFVEVNVERVNRTDKDLVRTPDQWTVGEGVLGMLGRLAVATLGESAPNLLVGDKHEIVDF